MSKNIAENYLDNLLGAINGNAKESDDEKRVRRLDLDEFDEDLDDDFLRTFEDELESDAYKSYFSYFDSEVEDELKSGDDKAFSNDINSIIQGIEENSGDVESIPAVPEVMKEVSKEIVARTKDEARPTRIGEKATGPIEVLKPEDILAEDLPPEGPADPLDIAAADRNPVPEPPRPPKPTPVMEEMPAKPPVKEEAPAAPVSKPAAKEELPPEQPLQLTEDMFMPMQDVTFPRTEDGEIDLLDSDGEDLLDLLAKSDEFSDLRGILNGEDVQESGEGDVSDAIGEYAAKEMQMGESVPEEKEKSEKKKAGFLGKFKKLLFGEEKEELAIGESAGTDIVQELSDENQRILMELEDETPKGGKKKEKKEKEKKPKKEKVKKEKPKKEPKPKKPPKPKKEKKPKVKDNTPPLPKKPVILIWAMAASMVALVLLGSSLSGYSSNMTLAKQAFNSHDYVGAYQYMKGLSIKKSDEQFFNQTAVLAAVSSEYEAYVLFRDYGTQDIAFDSLVSAAGRYKINLEDAAYFECDIELEMLRLDIETALGENYNMTLEEACQIYDSRTRKEYSIRLHKKMRELGLE